MKKSNRSAVPFVQLCAVAAACGVSCLLPGAAWADQIVLKDGDRITGNIVKRMVKR